MKRLRRDFAAYLHWYEAIGGEGVEPGPIERGTSPALEAFAAKESRGVYLPTSQPRLLRAALIGKSSLNLHICLWASRIKDGLRAGGIFAPTALEELREIRQEFPWLPAWVWRAVWRQAGGDVQVSLELDSRP